MFVQEDCYYTCGRKQFSDGTYTTKDDQLEFRANSIDYAWDTEGFTISFFRDDEPVAAIKASECVLQLPKDSIPELTIKGTEV